MNKILDLFDIIEKSESDNRSELDLIKKTLETQIPGIKTEVAVLQGQGEETFKKL